MLHRSCRRTIVCIASLGMLACTRVAAAQDAPTPAHAEIAALRAEVATLRAEIEAVKALVQGRMPPSHASDARVDMLQTQVAELAQVKVESASRMPVRLSGAVHTHAFANSGEANWLDLPNLVPAPPADGMTGSFSTALRQTRLGLAVDGPTIGGVRASGVVAMDFFGGVPGFQTGQVMGLPRLLVAFARLDGARTMLKAGQDHMVLAPRDPSSLAASSFPALFRAGNLYLRVPQITVGRTLGAGVTLEGGVLAPIAGDLQGDTYRFVPPVLSGERSRHPAFQARLHYASGAPDDHTRAAAGISGHYGRERRSASRVDRSWATVLDFAVRRNAIGAAGEIFSGSNLDAFGGGLGLDARAAGGWAELQFYPTSRLRLNGGAGLDRIQKDSRAFVRRRNRSVYGNVMFALTPEIEASLEYWWLATLPGTGAERRNHHVDWVLVYRF